MSYKLLNQDALDHLFTSVDVAMDDVPDDAPDNSVVGGRIGLDVILDQADSHIPPHVVISFMDAHPDMVLVDSVTLDKPCTLFNGHFLLPGFVIPIWEFRDSGLKGDVIRAQMLGHNS